MAKGADVCWLLHSMYDISLVRIHIGGKVIYKICVRQAGGLAPFDQATHICNDARLVALSTGLLQVLERIQNPVSAGTHPN